MAETGFQMSLASKHVLKRQGCISLVVNLL